WRRSSHGPCHRPADAFRACFPSARRSFSLKLQRNLPFSMNLHFFTAAWTEFVRAASFRPARLVLKRVRHKYRVFPLRAGGQQGDRCANQFLDMADIFDRLRRQIVPASRTPCRVFPAFQRLIDRLDPRLRALACRQIINLLAVQPIAGADLDLVQPVENIEFGERNTVNAVGGHRLAHEHRIEPAAAALATGYGAEFAPLSAEELADFVILLRRERPLAYTSRIGLGYAEHITDRARTHAGSDCSLSGNRIRRGHKGIGAVIDIEQGALRTLEQDA